ncbi:hypothetical protein NE237_001314 [Protea cynaroides]|uniref:C2H2-type domain-containing protein n=1 Tax=Protea cynaroides TaxID=273540 RepID=A0A9Q0KSV2_9MAGN|nr:hypothetical protein NE237_001314 [Protea cynaroides]
MEVDDRKNPSKQSMSPSKNALRTKWRTYCHGSGQDLMTGFKEEESLLLYNQSTGKENRICKVCNKGFSSGRALGGHMRVHTQHQQQQQQQPQLHEEQDHDLASTDILPIPNTNNSPMIRKLKLMHKRASRTDNATAAAAAPGGGSLKVKANVDPWRTSTTTTKTNSYSTNPSCSLCGKKFPSMKSLFGHMRCHPEREWRGIQPPPPPPPPPRPSSLPPAATPKNTSVPSTSTLSDKDSCGSHAHQQQHRVKTEIEMDDHDQLDSSLSTTARSVLSPAESLPSWSLTGKRGRKGIAMAIAAVPPPRAPSSEEPIPESDAAYHLLMLAHCYPPGQSFTSQSPSGGDGRNREYLPLPKKLKIDVANSSTSPSSRRDEEYFEITGIVHDDSINNKFNLKTDKGNSAFLALKLDTAQPVVERMNVQCTSSTFIRENYAGVSELAQGSMRQSRRGRRRRMN